MLKFVFILVLFPCLCFSQINTKDSKSNYWQNDKTPTQVYYELNITRSYRDLNPNAAYLFLPLYDRAKEVPTTLCSYGLGLITGLNPWLRFEGGLTFLQNGEAYSFVSAENDSTYAYKSRFRYIGMPLSLNLQYGKKFRVFGGAGINPLLFVKFKQTQEWNTETGSSYDAKLIEKNNGYQSFILQTFGQIGIQYSNPEGLGIMGKIIYRHQLTNSYATISDYTHKAFGWGFSLAVTKDL